MKLSRRRPSANILNWVHEFYESNAAHNAKTSRSAFDVPQEIGWFFRPQRTGWSKVARKVPQADELDRLNNAD